MNGPMLAATMRTDSDVSTFPLLVTPKIDGVRALIVGGTLVSRTMRPIPNSRIRAILEPLLPEGADGELFCGSLHQTTSTVMSLHAEGGFRFFWFDWAYSTTVPYYRRVLSMATYTDVHDTDVNYVSLLMPRAVHSLCELHAYEEQVLALGFEGLVVRIPNGGYKYGRSTLREGLMVKLKRSSDSEAKIIGVEELVHRANRATGEAGNTLGAIVARAPDGTVFKIGTGYTADQRLALWANRNRIVGMAVKYRHAECGSRGRPRCPVFLDLRHEYDMP